MRNCRAGHRAHVAHHEALVTHTHSFTVREKERERMAAAAAKDTEAVATRLLEARAYLRDFEQRHDPTDMEQQQVLREMRDHVGALERLAGEWVREVMTAMCMCMSTYSE